MAFLRLPALRIYEMLKSESDGFGMATMPGGFNFNRCFSNLIRRNLTGISLSKLSALVQHC